MVIPLDPERQTERLEAVRECLLYSSDANPPPFAVYQLYEALKAGLYGGDIENYFRGLPEYTKIKGRLAEALGAAELEFTTSQHYKPSMS